MSTSSLGETLISLQTCRLLLAPNDIRRAIYVHLFLASIHITVDQRDQLRLSSCNEAPIDDAAPEETGREFCGYISQASPPDYVYVECGLCKARTATWARRLRSS
jgi:hypothetical protein